MKSLKVSSFITPMSLEDSYSTHLDIFGKGGLHSVATVNDRDNISLQRRSEGMLSFSRDDKGMYSLLGGIGNENWFKIFDFKNNQLNFNVQCPPNYILLGNAEGIAKPSPILIDMQLDMVDIREELSTVHRLEYQHLLIGNKSGVAKPRMNIGIENLPALGAATLPLPDTSFLTKIPFIGASLADTVLNKLKEYAYLPNPTQPFNPTDLASNFAPTNMLSWIMGGAWLPETFVGSSGKVDPTSKETVASSALALTAVSLARAHKLFDNSSFIVSSKKVKFAWENYLAEEFANAAGGVPAKLYGYQNTYDYGDKAQALDELAPGLLKQNSDTTDSTKANGKLVSAISGEDYVNTANIPVGPLAIIDPLYPMAGHKLIAPTEFNIRKGVENEFGKVKDPQTQALADFYILEGEYAKLQNIALPLESFPEGSLLKIGIRGELAKAEPDVDFSLVGTVAGVASTLSAFKAAYETFQTAQTIFNTTQQTKDVAQDIRIAAAEAKATISVAEANAAALEATGAAAEATAAAATATGAAAAAGVSAAAAGASAIAAAASALLGGSKGDTGDTGPKGDKGDTGPQGPSGLSILEGDVLKEADSLVTRIKDNPIFRGQYIGIPTTSISPDSSSILFLHTVQI